MGCKKHAAAPAPDKLTTVRQQIAGEWELTKGVYIEYDETGNISYTEDLPDESPKPWYDFRKPDTLYRSDRHGREALACNFFVSEDGIAHIKIAASSWDISRTFDITAIDATGMTWVLDQRYPDAGPGTLSRVYTEYNFTKH